MSLIKWIVVSVLLLISVCISLVSCSKKDKPTKPKITTEASASIGPEGGIVEVNNSSSSLYGVKVGIPEGALEETKTITISVGPDDLPVPQEMVKASKSVLLEPESLVFDSLVTITIPYQDDESDEETVRLYRFNQNTASWEITELREVDTVSNQLIIQTLTFSLYQAIGLQKGNTLPLRSNLNFDPRVDNLTHETGPCFGEVSFVQWFWEHKKSDGVNLRDWHQNDHSGIAEMALKTTCQENQKTIGKDDKFIASSLMLALSQENAKPQILVFTVMGSHGTDVGHAILVYNYETRTEAEKVYIDFYVYDETAGPHVNPDRSKGLMMTFDGTSFYYGYPGPEVKPYWTITSKFSHVMIKNPKTLEFVYEYFNEPPVVTEVKPTGEITNRQPTLSAKIHYSFISTSLIKMSLNHNDCKPLTIQILDDHNAIVSFKVQSTLGDGEYQVDVEVRSGFPKCIGYEDIPAVKTSWTFTVSSSSTADIVGTWDLVRIVSVRDDGETYEVPSEEIQEDPLTYTFNSDHTAIQIYQDESLPFTWNISGNKLITDDMTYTFTVNSTTLTLTFQVMEEGRTFTITHYFSRR